jgi:hypothetical protein
MDGVLVDSYEAWFHLVNAAARDLGYPPINADQFRKMWGQGVDLDVEILSTRHTVPEIEGTMTNTSGSRPRLSSPQAGPMFDEPDPGFGGGITHARRLRKVSRTGGVGSASWSKD